MYSSTSLKYIVLGGSFWGNSGVSWAFWGLFGSPIARIQPLLIEPCSPPFADKFHSFLLTKKGLNAHLEPPHYCIFIVWPIASDKRALRPFLAARRDDIGQKITQIVLLGLEMGPKWAPNVPNHPKIGPKGFPQVLHILDQCHCT